SGKKLNIYLGIDPTATKIHLGHAVPLRKLQAFARLGHNVTFLIGDFTALIGDTSDKDTERPVLTSAEIEENFQTYKKQAEKILDFSKIKVKHNSEWLSKLDFKKVVELAQQFDFGEFAGRELIAKRLKEGKHVGLHEALYPVMQGYDSYFMDTDIQIGGTDQTFNMQAGRTLQKDLRNKESFVLAMEFLIGTDGKKMSKTGNNAIWLEDEPNDMYGKIMRIDDSVIVEYYKLATDVNLDAIAVIEDSLKKGQDPMHAKHLLAQQIVGDLYSTDIATQAREYFKKVIQNKEMPDTIPTVSLTLENGLISYIDLLLKTNLATSRSDARRLIEQGGVEIDNQKILDPTGEIAIKDNAVIKVGKRKFVEVTVA
ncbi:MAG TPA: tyrosine--tRNA ligase, partial [Patescibacteria group bacterium]